MSEVKFENVSGKVMWEGKGSNGGDMMRIETVEGVNVFGFGRKDGKFNVLSVSINEKIWRQEYRPILLGLHELVQKSEEKTQKAGLKTAGIVDEKLGLSARGYEGNTKKSTDKYQIKATDSFLFVSLFGTDDVRIMIDGSTSKDGKAFVKDKKFHVEKYGRYELKNPKYAPKVSAIVTPSVEKIVETGTPAVV